MNSAAFVDKRVVEVRNLRNLKQMAFTVTELLVVIATVALLAAMLLPALAGTQSQSKVTGCEARFRQWAASANLYANDNHGWLPTSNLAAGGLYAWDVGTNMPNALFPYGMDVPDWFCPMRPSALDAANAWARNSLGHPMQNTNDLRQYWNTAFASEISLNDNYWVPRNQGLGTSSFPVDYSTKSKVLWPPWLKNQTTAPTSAIYGWPIRLHDIASPYVPFVSDDAASGQGGGLNSLHVSTSVADIAPSTAHFVNGALLGVNLAFPDGHVVSHTPDQMHAVYYDSANYWFY